MVYTLIVTSMQLIAYPLHQCIFHTHIPYHQIKRGHLDSPKQNIFIHVFLYSVIGLV